MGTLLVFNQYVEMHSGKTLSMFPAPRGSHFFASRNSLNDAEHAICWILGMFCELHIVLLLFFCMSASTDTKGIVGSRDSGVWGVSLNSK